MVDRVKPLAHDHALADLLLDLVSSQRLDQHEANKAIEGSGIEPAWKQSLSHDRGEVALLNVEHVSCGESGAGTISGLNDALSVVESVNDGLVQLPVVVIHGVSLLLSY